MSVFIVIAFDRFLSVSFVLFRLYFMYNACLWSFSFQSTNLESFHSVFNQGPQMLSPPVTGNII